MFQFGIRRKDTREIIGQLPRLIFGDVKSFVGTVPIGNTGGEAVPLWHTMDSQGRNHPRIALLGHQGSFESRTPSLLRVYSFAPCP